MSKALTEYLLCSKFGWTLEELRMSPASDIEMFSAIMGIEAQFQNRESNKLKK